MKVALITGITGQDGSYLAELLLEKGYEVRQDNLYPFVGYYLGSIARKENLSKIVHCFYWLWLFMSCKVCARL